MKVTYIRHSGFLVELAGHILLFDYFQGQLPAFDRSKQLLVFSSHSHYDHFNREILGLRETYPDVRYVFPKDIRIRKEERDASMHFMQKRDEMDLAGCHIRTIRSNDAGVAFLVSAPGTDGRVRQVYHAGDLNWWHWEEEPADFNRRMRQEYQSELERLKDARIDLAFLVLDPRQGESCFWGFDYFMRQVGAGCAVPMHMWEEYDVCDRLLARPESEPYRERVHVIHAPGECFSVPEKNQDGGAVA